MTLAMSRKLLLVEDDAIVALNEKRILERNGFEVEVVHSGEFVLVQSIEMALKLCEAHRRTIDEKERYRLITENISETVLTVDTQFNVTYVSPSITDLTGFTPAEYAGMGPHDALTEESARKAIESGRRQQEAGEQSPESESHANVLELKRRIVTLIPSEGRPDEEARVCQHYVNRLSDYLFVPARYCEQRQRA